MTDWYEFLRGVKPVGDVLEFEKPKRDVQHVDSTTIVERIEMTPELKAEFEAAGYTIEIGAMEDENQENES